MSPERLRQIEELYRAVLEGTVDERAVLLAQADPELRREVESLLVTSPGGEFLDRPAILNAPHLLEDSTLTRLASGAYLGPYRIESKLGEGGMGEVFRAVDTRLGRAVAIKIIRDQFTARFGREARAISSLNHPNICMLFDVGSNYLVMELVEGETLAARLKQGPIPIQTALLYSSQIAAVLEVAHGKGIVHRDLKPGNIMTGKNRTHLFSDCSRIMRPLTATLGRQSCAIRNLATRFTIDTSRKSPRADNPHEKLRSRQLIPRRVH